MTDIPSAHPTERLTIAAFADAGAAIGLGHLRRTGVLAEALRARGHRVLLATPCPPPDAGGEADGLARRVTRAPGELPAADVTLVDSYRVTAAELAARRRASPRLAMLDDLADRRLDADLVINPNLQAPELDYRGLTDARLLTGLRYCPVAPAFAAARAAPRPGPRVLVAFGGTDDGRLALAAAQALREGSDWPLDLVVSPLCPLPAARRAALAALPGVTLHQGADMAALMARSSHYLGAAGTTVWEALSAGLTPVVAAIADNQRPGVAALAAAGVAAFDRFDPAALAAALATAAPPAPLLRELDGGGAARVACAIEALAAASPQPDTTAPSTAHEAER